MWNVIEEIIDFFIYPKLQLLTYVGIFLGVLLVVGIKIEPMNYILAFLTLVLFIILGWKLQKKG